MNNVESTCCWRCNSEKLIRRGKQFNAKKTVWKQVWVCKNCGLKFADKTLHLVDYEEEKFIYQDKEVRTTDWTQYNHRKQEEKENFLAFATELLDQFEFKQLRTGGRPATKTRDLLLGMLVKIYAKKPSRDTISELKLLKKLGYVEQVPCYVTLLNCFANPSFQPILEKMLELSSLPFRGIENTMSIDGSGLGVSKYTRWFDEKYGEPKEKRMYRKIHLMIGTRSLVITSASVTAQEGQNSSDTSQFPELLRKTAINFNLNSICADMGYLSGKNFDLAESIGADLYIPFKKNSKGRGNGSAWKKMYHLFQNEPQTFLRKYHERSMSETAFSTIKSKFNSYLLTKNYQSNVNEALTMCIAHNLCRLNAIHSEMNLETTSLTEAQKGQKIAIKL